jgi:hypothetical protein
MFQTILQVNLCVSPLSFHMETLLYQHGQYALDTSRTLFLLASTQGGKVKKKKKKKNFAGLGVMRENKKK